MRILGIETATVVCAAAVAVDGSVAAEVALEQQSVHAEKLLTLIDQAMRTAALSVADLDGVAVSIGPGSFTGLRIGLSVAKGLAYAAGKPLLAVPTLEALAYAAHAAGNVPPAYDILAILDARREEVYCQLFHIVGERPAAVWAPRDRVLRDLVGDLGTRNVVVTGDAVPKFAAYMRSVPERSAAQYRYLDHNQARASGGSVALLGTDLLVRGIVENPATLEPKYIKEFFFKTL